MNMFLSAPQSHLLYIVIVIGVVIGIGTVMIVGRPARLRQIYRESVPQFAAERLVKTLKIQRDKDKSLEDVGTKIPPTLVDYKTLSHPLNNLSQLFFDEYRRNSKPNALILGEPGIGKTTLLHQYALNFMDKELDKTDPEKTRLPIFLPLHEWAKRKQPFDVFLLNYLMRSKDFPRNARNRSLLHYWMNQGKLILLLDGLDEMDKEDAKKCIEALNNFVISPFIVSCRIERYETLLSEQSILEVNEIAVMQRPKAGQAQRYLNQEGATEFSSSLYQADTNQDHKEIVGTSRILEVLAQSFPDILNQDPQEISFTPLMLRVFAQAFSDTSGWQLSTSNENIWKIYTREMIKSKEAYYSENYLRSMWHGLTQLAVYMGERQFFYFRPDNLPDKKSRILYTGSTWLIILLLGGAASLLAIWGTFPLWQLLLMIGIIAGFYGYLRKSFLTGLFMNVFCILALCYPFFAVAAATSQEKTWLQRGREVLTTLALIFLLPVLLNVLVFIGTQIICTSLWPSFLATGIVVLLIEGFLCYTFYRLGNLQFLQPITNNSPMMDLFFGLVYLLIVRHVDPLAPDILTPKISIKSIRAPTLKIAIGLVIGIAIGIAGLLFWQTNLLLIAILLGISIWFDMGLGAVIQGCLLRFWFCRSKVLPRNASFLDDAVACSLLVKQEDCFNFFHGTPMQEYFRNEPPQSHTLDGIPPLREKFSSVVQLARSPDAERGQPLGIFCWHDGNRKDKKMFARLQSHLKHFERIGKFRTWSHTDVQPGVRWKEEISRHLENADIILLLISPDFLASYSSEEMTRALQRHNEGRAVVLPILLRPTLLQGAPFEKLLPRGARAVSLCKGPELDNAYNDIVRQINQVVSDTLMLRDEA